jgi:hypothetical protein
MTDIVERLRTESPSYVLIGDAVVEIEQLRRDRKLDFELMDTFVKEINRLKRVLRLIASMESDSEFGAPPMATAQKIAQDALDDG